MLARLEDSPAERRSRVLLATLRRFDEALARVDEAVGGFTRLDEKDAATAAVRLREDITRSADSPEG